MCIGDVTECNVMKKERNRDNIYVYKETTEK